MVKTISIDERCQERMEELEEFHKEREREVLADLSRQYSYMDEDVRLYFWNTGYMAIILSDRRDEQLGIRRIKRRERGLEKLAKLPMYYAKTVHCEWWEREADETSTISW